MRCDDFERDLPAFLDGEISGEEAEAFQRHLRICGRCRAARASFDAVDLALDALRVPPGPAQGFAERVHARIQREAKLPAAAQRPARMRVLVGGRGAGPWVPLAAAAGVLVAVGLYFAWPASDPSAPAQGGRELAQESHRKPAGHTDDDAASRAEQGAAAAVAAAEREPSPEEPLLAKGDAATTADPLGLDPAVEAALVRQLDVLEDFDLLEGMALIEALDLLEDALWLAELEEEKG